MHPAEQALVDAQVTAAAAAGDVDSLRGNIAQMQEEITQLRGELVLRRKRDETLRFYMMQFDEEQRLAAKLQRDFLPKTFPQLGKVRFESLFRPASYVSGDFYDVMRLDEDHVGFFIADAVGHGMPAALLSMYVKRALVTKEITPDGYRLLDPGVAMARLNESLIEQELSQATFATALYGYINVHTLECTFARGGHPSPFLISAEGKSKSLEAEGSLLGIFPGEEFTTCKATLSPGDKLFIFTDGIEVSFGACGETLNTEQWRQELLQRHKMPADKLIADLCQSLDNQAGSLTPKDDLTMMILQVL